MNNRFLKTVAQKNLLRRNTLDLLLLPLDDQVSNVKGPIRHDAVYSAIKDLEDLRCACRFLSFILLVHEKRNPIEEGVDCSVRILNFIDDYVQTPESAKRTNKNSPAVLVLGSVAIGAAKVREAGD